jgi:hypothetical protein
MLETFTSFSLPLSFPTLLHHTKDNLQLHFPALRNGRLTKDLGVLPLNGSYISERTFEEIDQFLHA